MSSSAGRYSKDVAADVDLVRTMLAECIGSFFVVFVTLGAVFASAVVTFDTVTVDRLLLIALAYGFTYGSVVYALSFPSMSDGDSTNTRHLNPALTAALFLSFNLSAG